MKSFYSALTFSFLAVSATAETVHSSWPDRYFPVHREAGRSSLVVLYKARLRPFTLQSFQDSMAREGDPGLGPMTIRELIPPLLVYWETNLFAIDPDLMQDQVLVQPRNRNHNPAPGVCPLHFYQGDSETSATMTRLVQAVKETHSKPGENVFPDHWDDFLEILWRTPDGVEEFTLPADEVRAFFANEQSPYEVLLTDRERRYSAAFMDVLLEVIRLQKEGTRLPPEEYPQKDLYSPPLDDRSADSPSDYVTRLAERFARIPMVVEIHGTHEFFNQGPGMPGATRVGCLDSDDYDSWEETGALHWDGEEYTYMSAFHCADGTTVTVTLQSSVGGKDTRTKILRTTALRDVRMEKKTPHQLLEMVFSLGRMNEGLVLVEPQTYSEWDGMSVKEYAAPDGITTILADPENGRPLVKLLIDNEGRIISRTRYSYSVSTPYPAAIFFETGDMEQKGAEEFYKTIRQSFEILPLDEDKEEMRRRAARFSELPEGVNVHEGNRETGKRRFIPRDRER